MFNGDLEIGVSVIYMMFGFDVGLILVIWKIGIELDDDGVSFECCLFEYGVDVVYELLDFL